MKRWFGDLDRILRGEATRVSDLQGGKIDIPTGGLCIVLVLLGFIYGACMGSFAIMGSGSGAGMQMLASTLKVPALFLLTLVVTLPSLYVFNALVGSRLRIGAMLRLLIASMGVTMAVLASLGTIVAFFGFSTTSYPFMVLLNVAVYAMSGFLGLAFLLRTLERLSVASEVQASVMAIEPAQVEAREPSLATSSPDKPGHTEPGADPAPEALVIPPPIPGALDRVEGHLLGPHVKTVFRIWVAVFGLVGAQMGWVLRPFIGHPDLPFTWFRERDSNFFIAVLRTIGKLFGGA